MYDSLFDRKICKELLPPDRTNDFFEALFGDAAEGAYDIELQYRNGSESEIQFDLLLHERPGSCLACNLTQGLPEVFSRHPIINITGIVERVNELLGEKAETGDWSLGFTEQRTNSLHVIPLKITLS